MDGVYEWNHVLKAGGSYAFRIQDIPFSVFAEMGLVITRYTINGGTGPGNKEDYKALDDVVYRAGTGFINGITSSKPGVLMALKFRTSLFRYSRKWAW
jgi:hypothetical protein